MTGQATRRTNLLGFAVVVAVAVGFLSSPLATFVDGKFLDVQFRWLRQLTDRSVEPDVALVGIDAETFDELVLPLGLWQRHFATFFAAMEMARPSLVGVDLIFERKRYAPSPQDGSLVDQEFLELRNAYNRELQLAVRNLTRGSGDGDVPVPVVLVTTLDEEGHPEPLLPGLERYGTIGMAELRPDADGVVRRYGESLRDLTGTEQGGDLTTFVARMLPREARGFGLGIIDYSVATAFDYVPLQDVLRWQHAGDAARLERTFGGRPVLLGAVTSWDDQRWMPVPMAAWQPQWRRGPGLLVHAQALRSFLRNGGLIEEVSTTALLLSGLAVSLLWWIGHWPRWAVPLFVVALLVWAAWSTRALTMGAFWPVASVGMTGAFALFGRTALEGGIAWAERRRLKRSFGGYVSPAVLDEILAGRIRPGMHGERRRVCVLFSDIRSFTTRSQSQSAERIVSLLNEYFREMTAAVHAHGGTVDKFIGDGLMAFFGAPQDQEAPSRNAYRAATEMLDRLVRLNERFRQQGIEPVAIGIGLHVGDAIVGHVGSEGRHEYTVIGDTVNVAARLEGLTKTLGRAILSSEDVARDLGDESPLESLGEQPIRGRWPLPVFGSHPGPQEKGGTS